MRQFLHNALARQFYSTPLPIESNRFHGRINTNFVTELEAISDGFFRVVDFYAYAVQIMDFHLP